MKSLGRIFCWDLFPTICFTANLMVGSHHHHHLSASCRARLGAPGDSPTFIEQKPLAFTTRGFSTVIYNTNPCFNYGDP